MGGLPIQLLSAGARALASVPRPLLAKIHADRRLQFFNDHQALADKAAFKAYLEPLYKTAWSVFAKKPFAGTSAVLAYLSRYTHRVAISNRRLIAADDRTVTFKWKDYRAEGASGVS